MRRFRPAVHPAVRLLVAVAVGIAGMWLALLIAGRSDYEVGPFRVELFARPGRGLTEIALPPFGRIQADTHAPPIRLTATVDMVDPQNLSAVIARRGIDGLIRQTERGAYAALRVHVLRALAVGVAGALLASLLTYRRRWSRVLAGVGGATFIFLLSGALAWATYTPAAFVQPTFTGSLTLAPRVIGPLQEATGRIEDFRLQLARLVGAAADAYDVIVNEPRPSGQAIAVLHISDVHISPIGMDFAQRLARSFDVDVVVDTGDLTSFGSALEQAVIDRIRGFGRAYVFVRGNHDSAEIGVRVAAIPNTTVPDGRVVEVAGLRIFGAAHPLFTPEESRALESAEIEVALEERADELLEMVEQLDAPPDIVAVHDDRMAEPLAGTVPLVISGHFHETEARMVDGTVFLRVGSTGGGGFEGIGTGRLTAQILYLEGSPPALVAYDVIDLDQETGSLTVERTVREHLIEPLGPSPSPSPSPES